MCRSHAMILRGWALVGQGQGEEGHRSVREGLVAYRATGADLECSHCSLLAEAYRENGQSEEGLRVIAEALDHVETEHNPASLARFLSLRGTTSAPFL